ncbi:MAG: cell division protein ZapA [Bacteroidia bacterium]
MEQHSINIHILGRQFPTRVSTEEKEIVEEAARRINAQISQFKATYHTQDDLNLAIMACLKFATDLVRLSQESAAGEQELKKTLDTLEKQLSMHLE